MMPHTPTTQRGVALFITLIMLIAMTVAALSLVRIVDSGNIIAGNLAFRQAALQSTDYGIEAARLKLVDVTSSLTSANQSYGWGDETCDDSAAKKDGCQYIPVMMDTDDEGAPKIDWDKLTNIFKDDTSISGTALSSYQVKYFIDRLCNVALADGKNLTEADMPEKCMAIVQIDEGANLADSGGQKSRPFDTNSAYYRVTVRAEGPRGTATNVQVIMYKPL